MHTDPSQRREIGVFDSGVGGFTVLRELRTLLPTARLRYLADTAYAPYGNRSPEDIRARSFAISEHLIERGADLIVIACNTATAHAIEALRARWPDRLFVGTEPGIKPAVAASDNGRIGLLATPATAASARLQALIERHAGGHAVTVQGCAGVVDHIEAGDLDSAELKALVARYCAPLLAAGVDTALLGCTHFPLIEPLWRAALGPRVKLLRIETAVARRTADLWHSMPAASAALSVETSGSPERLQAWMAAVLGWREAAVEGWKPSGA
ncbi:MAG: glutamate racemase [Roseateles sp.]|jgi:glutamate racemase|uniref:glutamate racemase n=3 Tax=cellular organisms TaxID=131567 RepID=A0A7S3XSJ1_HETAK|nr:glutamate racemase [Methylibium sp.]MBY0367224.1 glutamate racemase [Burkholderiaceae bacterium]|mmetsp:Transcript_42342/g.99587  ORF Transcript_42342/g.99587 Transcript_42342/m.99587 type:complete len:269 (+) Transcript_42342:541-1347(+)